MYFLYYLSDNHDWYSDLLTKPCWHKHSPCLLQNWAMKLAALLFMPLTLKKLREPVAFALFVNSFIYLFITYNIVSKISQKIFKLGLWYLADLLEPGFDIWQTYWSWGVGHLINFWRKKIRLTLFLLNLDTVLDPITAHAPISAQSNNLVI